jgi:hypothetical protein
MKYTAGIQLTTRVINAIFVSVDHVILNYVKMWQKNFEKKDDRESI